MVGFAKGVFRGVKGADGEVGRTEVVRLYELGRSFLLEKRYCDYCLM